MSEQSIGGTCKSPFLDESIFAKSGGYTLGRFCSRSGNVSCCLPCPMDQWVYDEGFLHSMDNLGYVAIVSVIFSAFVVVSWLVLPPSRTHRHYLSLGLIISIGLLALSFVIPIASNPGKCFDHITPTDMSSSKLCAVTGVLFVGGCLGTEAWLFLRVLWLHMRIYWFRTPGRAFTIFSLCLGILWPVTLLAITSAVSGFSYRTSGKMCIINHEYSFPLFWTWTIGLALASFFLQVFTSGYCLAVFLRSKSKLESFDMSSEGRPNRQRQPTFQRVLEFGLGSSVHFETNVLTRLATRQRWNQMQSVVLSQWRSFALCLALVIQCIPFVAHFVKSNTHDKTQKLTDCLFNYGFDDRRCMDQKRVLSSAQTTILAGLIIAALAGLECVVLTTRASTLITWYYIFKNPIKTLRHSRYPDTDNSRKSSHVDNSIPQYNPRRRSMDDIYALGGRRLPRSPSPVLHFRFCHSRIYSNDVSETIALPVSSTPLSPRTPTRGHSETNRRRSDTISAHPSRRHSYDHTFSPPLTTIIQRLSRIHPSHLVPPFSSPVNKPLPPLPVFSAPSSPVLNNL